ncbi:MAG: dihydropyrimidinase [Spirochaetaceae bacterium]|jgi:dihydropyrimidinase|nr:dihydropyrimidinase [Spirochaetaceae bacterium]
MKQILIKNAFVVCETDEADADVLVKDEKIAEIGKYINAPDAYVIDARNKILIPGGVDIHTHFCLDVGFTKASDDFYTGTVAAAFGGTTTIVDHPGFGPEGCALNYQIEAYHLLARDKAVIDYGFHGVVQHVNSEILSEMNTLVKDGITSFKIYLTYNYRIEDKEAFNFISHAASLGALTAVHAENHGVIEALRERFKAQNLLSPYYHALSRPDECEAEAVSRMALIARLAGDAPLYIVHLSSALSLEFVKAARERGQRQLFVETCPQYLFLDASRYEEEKHGGLKYIMCPPLRSAVDNTKLIKGLENDIDVVATDHCPFFFASQKLRGKDDFMLCPSGAPGVEERIPLLFSAVIKRRLGLKRFVELCCENPAKIAGIYPQKGVIRTGSDADLVIINPNEYAILSAASLKSNVDYSVYEGFKTLGMPETVISRGEIIVDHGKLSASAGRGRFLKRAPAQTPR